MAQNSEWHNSINIVIHQLYLLYMYACGLRCPARFQVPIQFLSIWYALDKLRICLGHDTRCHKSDFENCQALVCTHWTVLHNRFGPMHWFSLNFYSLILYSRRLSYSHCNHPDHWTRFWFTESSVFRFIFYIRYVHSSL